MLSILSWALVALPLTEARFGIRPRAQNNMNETAQCCPCVSSGFNPQDTTVTVTVTGPKETVTVSHTVAQQATAVFVTHTVASGSPSAAIHEVTTIARPPTKIETVLNAVSSSGPSRDPGPIKTVTKTVQPGNGQLGDGSESPKTVTVTVNPDEPKSVEASSVVTLDANPQNSVLSTPLPNTVEPSASGNDQATGASTVTVTIGTQSQASQTAESKPSIQTVTFVQTPSGAGTVTFVENLASPTAATVTSAGTPANSPGETVAADKGPASPSTATVTLAKNPSKPGTETVTFVENPTNQGSTAAAAATTTPAGDVSNSTAQTLTFAEDLPQSGSSASTRSSPSPSVQTMDFAPNGPNPAITTSSPAQPAITTPPQLGTILPVTDSFTTLTQTMTSGGNVTVEITIVNIFTGEAICRKEGSDEPCDSTHETLLLKPSGEVPCLTTGIFTKTATATAFNTVVVTVSPGLWANGTFATGVAPPAGAASGTGSPMLRRGRVPMVRRRL
ncbi:hypothetical protein MKX07_005217 [Trichoderma sp. CBMAI-0711]|uniref:Uncharacterized protein n=1 Tax=Trichoderma parareesei TaxID=858221 RepID=A0A2H2Z437_TRIPA|nr:hypothetical protein MKX07_005217 [Trichoderma sp. CBMAI-0711]OTA00312.1 hypothetical protein A9Z42_0078940 [Trichoderma parareesei]